MSLNVLCVYSRTAVMIQAGARDLPQYFQQVGRGGRDGGRSLCVCFVAAADTDGIRTCIKQANVSAASAKAILRSIRRMSRSAGCYALLHLEDFEKSGVSLPQVKGVIADCAAGAATWS